jgi:proteasome assembly chaperone (PAC2) family protein
MTLYDLHERPELQEPLLVLALDGWIDAGMAAAAAAAALLAQLRTTPVATFDADLLLDHRSRRPVMDLVEGVHVGLTWPSIELRAARDQVGRDLLVLIGAEPDFRWRAFADDVVTLAVELGTTMVVGLGAYPAPVPHTRPSSLATTATTPELAAQAGTVRATLKVPAGAAAAIERRCVDAGIPAVGLWAQVPHYAAAVEYPAASALLLEGLNQLGGCTLDVTPMHQAAVATRNRLDALIANSAEHQQLVHQLEAQVDAETPEPEATPMSAEDLPTGDELAAEFEDFLRDQDPDGEG